MNDESKKLSKLELISNNKKIDWGWDQQNFEGQTCSLMNERITEDIVRNHFKNDSLFESIKLEEQRSKHERIKKLLGSASKKGTGKSGFPEFIITFPSSMNSVIIVECKSDTKHHRHKLNEQQDIEKYAVDGVVHYSKFLKKEFNVIAIAVSGQDENHISISNFLIKKDGSEKELPDKKLLSIYDYLALLENEKYVEKLKHENILLTASTLNEKLYNYSVPENERAAIVSGILIALQSDVFRKGYQNYQEPSHLVDDLLIHVGRILKKNRMSGKIPALMNQYN